MHPSAVPAWMLHHATRCRLAGDWQGAYAAARVEADVNLRLIRHDHGAAVADRVKEDLRHLVPDLLRWSLPRGPDGLLRTGVSYPLDLLPDGHTLVARPPARAGLPQCITIHFERLGETRTGQRDDTLVLLRDRWDSRCTAEVLTRCGGVERLPFFTPAGERLPEALVGGPGAEGLVERVIRLDESGHHAEAWAAAGFRLDVLLFDPRWSRDRLDPAAFDPRLPAGDRDRARDEAVRRSLAWLRPVHTTLAASARRIAAHLADLRRKGWPTDVEECGLFRIDVRGRCLILDALDTPNPRVRLVTGTPYGRADDARRRAERDEFGIELSRVPRIPLVLARRPDELTNPAGLHPLVHATLFPAAPPLAVAAPAPLPETVRVHCDHATHEVAMRAGEVVLPHTQAEIDRERMLQALGGQVQGCVAARDGWRDPAVRMPRPMRALRADVLTLIHHGDGPALAAALDRGLDPFVRDGAGRTLLHLLPWLAGADLLPRLLAAGLDVGARDAGNETPLHTAVAHGTPDLVRDLVAAGADLRAKANGRMAWVTTRSDLAFLRRLAGYR